RRYGDDGRRASPTDLRPESVLLYVRVGSQGDDECAWPGVTCRGLGVHADGAEVDEDDLRVVGLSVRGDVSSADRRGVDLVGALPLELAFLINLEQIDLSHNRLDGELRGEVLGWENVRVIELNDNLLVSFFRERLLWPWTGTLFRSAVWLTFFFHLFASAPLFGRKYQERENPPRARAGHAAHQADSAPQPLLGHRPPFPLRPPGGPVAPLPLGRLLPQRGGRGTAKVTCPVADCCTICFEGYSPDLYGTYESKVVDGSKHAVSADKMSELKIRLVQASEDHGTKLLDVSTPEFRAYAWLAEDARSGSDGGDYDDAQLLRRYALSAVYFSAEGGNWLRRDGWLTPKDECEWEGVSGERSPPEDHVPAGPAGPEHGVERPGRTDTEGDRNADEAQHTGARREPPDLDPERGRTPDGPRPRLPPVERLRGTEHAPGGLRVEARPGDPALGRLQRRRACPGLPGRLLHDLLHERDFGG
ncbi:hypothetical protein THAOC_07406, partial [Thalassiosira oceanica]